ncbi:hypothetical protein FSARC_14370 [Fusarium sarcochroum]|uniref:F-box domain-containing protein n=1 Tax=Fusarium sarcochroum TaxID=1208366 RepID=A0A8H4WPX9_9HYPO|nr:hypothetical protein FSARC_14370 [Fusarium sarcochroum]
MINMTASRQGTQPAGLSTLAPEIYSMIMKELLTGDFFNLMQTSKAINHLTTPFLYYKLYTREGTDADTTGLVNMLKEKPWITDLVHALVIDELDEGAYRELLAFDFPNLEVILLQHEKKVKLTINKEEKQELNKHILPKSQLTNFVCNIMRNPYNYQPEHRKLHKFQIHDAILFSHPALTRLRLCYVDLTAFKDASVDMFPFEHLTELLIEVSRLNIETLRKILLPAKALQTFRYHQEVQLNFTLQEFRDLLYKFKDTLKVLKLPWRRIHEGETTGMDLSDFTALKLLIIDPRLLFGPWDVIPDVYGHIRKRMPPNVKLLVLDELRLPYHGNGGDTDALVHETNIKLLQTIVEHKWNLVPQLRCLLYYDAGNLKLPKGLKEQADAQKITMWAEDVDYDPDPTSEWLDASWVFGEPGSGESRDESGNLKVDEGT